MGRYELQAHSNVGYDVLSYILAQHNHAVHGLWLLSGLDLEPLYFVLKPSWGL